MLQSRSRYLCLFQGRDQLFAGPMYNWVVVGVNVSVDLLQDYVEYEDNVVFIDARTHLALDKHIKNIFWKRKVNKFESICRIQ